jgi:hypothetical protein
MFIRDRLRPRSFKEMDFNEFLEFIEKCRGSIPES